VTELVRAVGASGTEDHADGSHGAGDAPWLLYTARQRAVFLAVLFLVGASNNIDRNILGVLLPQIKAEFALSDTELGLLSGIVFAFFYATLGIPVARWADRGDRPLILSLSLFVWSAMTALCGLAQSFWQLALARIGVGAGEAGALPTAQSLIADYFPPEKRAGAMGFFMLSAAMGYAGGLILGGYVAQHYGWRTAFLIVGLAGVAAAPVGALLLKEPRKAAAAKVTVEPMRVALAELIRNPAYRCMLYAIVIYFFMGYGALVFIVSLMTRAYGASVQVAGATFGTISVFGSIVGVLFGGYLANRLARRNLANLPRTAGWAMIICVPVFEFALSRSTLSAMYAPLFIGVMLQSIMSPPMFSSLYLVCNSNRRATALAIVLLFANLIGLGLGPFLAGAISDYLAPTLGNAESLRWAIMILFVVMFAAGGFMLRAARYIEQAIEEGRPLTAS
jgi:MFS family permease